MSYRDEYAAAIARAESLQRELDATKSELAQLKLRHEASQVSAWKRVRRFGAKLRRGIMLLGVGTIAATFSIAALTVGAVGMVTIGVARLLRPGKHTHRLVVEHFPPKNADVIDV